MYCCRNEKIARESNYEKNKSFKREGHELHMIRIKIHTLCVRAAGEDWDSRKHNCPINMFSNELSELINNAVDLGNWAAIELYDPTGGWDF